MKWHAVSDNQIIAFPRVVQVEDETIHAPKPLPWYPNNHAWYMSFSRQQLRKLPLLNEIHEFMKKVTCKFPLPFFLCAYVWAHSLQANDAGSISRQEAVSMVPPLFLDVQPHHAVSA